MALLSKAAFVMVFFVFLAGCTGTGEENPIPPEPNPHIHNLLESYGSTPGQKGIFPGIIENADMARKQMELAQKQTSIEASREYVQRGLNVIAGPGGEGYSENALDPGDGFGILNYLQEAENQLNLARDYAHATENEKLNTGLALDAISNSRKWIEEAHDMVLFSRESGHYEEVVGYAGQADALLEMAINGNDINGDGEIDHGSEGGIQAAMDYLMIIEEGGK